MKILYFLESFLKSREDETKSFSYKPKTIQSEVIVKLLDWMVLVISSVLFINVLLRAERFFLQPWLIGVPIATPRQ